MFGKLDINLERMFKDMLIMDQVRGPHSTGVVSVNRNTQKSQYQKKLGTPDELMNDKRFSDLFMGQLGCLIGHNRYATKGAINRQNAHPFDMDGLIGVHNGTLSSYTRLEDHNKFDVDSQALYNHIDAYGLKDALSKVIGAYALMWWDKKESTVNIIRNVERPLYIAETDDGAALIVSSEPGILIACGAKPIAVLIYTCSFDGLLHAATYTAHSLVDRLSFVCSNSVMDAAIQHSYTTKLSCVLTNANAYALMCTCNTAHAKGLGYSVRV